MPLFVTALTKMASGVLKERRVNLSTFIHRHGGWASKISGALVDQSVFAGSNFVINIMLARFMPVEAYGAFVVVYTWFLLAQNLYDAFLTEPMAIIGSGKYINSLKAYFGYTFVGHVIIALVLAGLLGIAAVIASVFDSEIVAHTMLAAAVCCPLLLTRWLTRQPFYIVGQPQFSTIGGLIYFAASMAGVFALEHFHMLTPVSAMLVLGVASILSSVLLSVVFIKPSFDFNATPLSRADVIKDHWDYGKWSSGSKIATWLPTNLYYVVLPLLVSLGASAALRAMSMVLMPINMGLSAALGILLPMFSRTYITSGREGLKRQLRVVLIGFVTVSTVYCLVFAVFGQQMISILYDGQFDSYVTFPILLTMGMVPILTSVNIVLDAALRVTGGIKQSFLSTLLPGLLVITLGVWLLSQYGILGANIGSVVIGIVGTLILVMFFRRSGKLRMGETAEALDTSAAAASGSTSSESDGNTVNRAEALL